MYRNVVRYVMHCRECQRRKSAPQRPPGRLVPIPPAIAPFHRIGIDLLGRFPKSAHGNKWIIVCTDYSTRYAITKALPTAEVAEIAKFLLEKIVLRHGAPRVIITDRGAVFRSRLVSFLVDLCNIDHRFTTAYHPQTNGLTERFNKTLADMLSMYVDVEQKNWDEILPFVTFAYNTAKQETTGFTPFYLLHGREAETTLDTMLPFCPNDFDDNNITKIATRAEESRQLARVHTLRAQDKDQGCGSPVVKVSNHGRHVMSSIQVPLKTRRVGQRCTLNLSRAETSSRWCGVVVRRGGASSGVVHVT
ncbi:retrovirus-related Pol polyprotein from transposon 412 [Trichonephila clavipes]|uniref:Retrovirus-related Pol polyprotein from transposon 412 n=1 Tax=Trichonephila clavipes TaxID=2585209 RepID=A0A8X7BJN8_TRICX|nr:retrovirus-related Pol polyprotein from transposon 412 [Trichonephila clavipes]